MEKFKKALAKTQSKWRKIGFRVEKLKLRKTKLTGEIEKWKLSYNEKKKKELDSENAANEVALSRA